MEVEEMINKLREEQGHPVDMKQLTASCVANVVMNMIFGHRFDHSDPSFQRFLSAADEWLASISLPLEMCPMLRFLPYFKKNLAIHFRSLNDVSNFINNNILACTEVRNSFCDLVRFLS